MQIIIGVAKELQSPNTISLYLVEFFQARRSIAVIQQDILHPTRNATLMKIGVLKDIARVALGCSCIKTHVGMYSMYIIQSGDSGLMQQLDIKRL